MTGRLRVYEGIFGVVVETLVLRTLRAGPRRPS